jgi:hypothetical protein
MPYSSQAQQGLFHSKNSPVDAAEVAKFDAASKGQHGLPEHVKAKPGSKEHRRKHIGKAIAKAHKDYADKYGPTNEKPPADGGMPENFSNRMRI